MNQDLTNLSNSSNIEELEREHHKLEKQLGKLEKHPIADHDRIRDIKKLKLQLKDQLIKLKAEDGTSGSRNS
jgi:hypothetical protein